MVQKYLRFFQAKHLKNNLQFLNRSYFEYSHRLNYSTSKYHITLHNTMISWTSHCIIISATLASMVCKAPTDRSEWCTALGHTSHYDSHLQVSRLQVHHTSNQLQLLLPTCCTSALKGLSKKNILGKLLKYKRHVSLVTSN